MNKRQWTSLFARRRSEILAALVILAFFALCFVPIILQGKFFLMLDSFSEMLPERAVAWNMIRHGSLPLWTPLLLSGYPLLSMAQIGLGYPLTWGYLFLPPYWAEQIYVLAPFLLTPAFTYCYARHIGRSSTASLFAALAYGYGGVLVIPDIHNGLLPNATMWMPLFLIAIERARTGHFITSCLWATVPYAMSVLTGVGQGFLFIALVGVAYSLFIVTFAGSFENKSHPLGWNRFVRWRPLVVTLTAITSSAGISAFQILETMRAQRRSIRANLTYEMFTDPSLTFWGVIKFVLITPFYSFQDVCTAYVAPLALIMTFVAVYAMLRRKLTDSRSFFWLGAAVGSWVLMMGANTPLYRVLYYIPVLNKFREPPRHAVIWTFAIAMLSAYGLDALTKLVSARIVAQRRIAAIAVGLLVLSGGVGFYWSKPWGPYDLTKFLTLKAVFTFLLALSLWFALKLEDGLKAALVTLTIALACFLEPYTLIRNWWWPMTKPASRITNPTASTRFLQQYPPEQNRVYTYVEIFAEELSPFPIVDCPNLTMLHGLQNVAGYEPLFLRRYSRALGNVWHDGVTTLKGFEPDREIFQASSHVLDLLNSTYLLTFSNPLSRFDYSIERDGVRFATRSPKVDLRPDNSVAFSAMTARADEVVIVSSLANSADAQQGTPVATVRVTTMHGRVIERQLRAGIDTAEWAHDRPDVQPTVGHSLAPIFERRDGDQRNSSPGYNYWTRLDLGSLENLDRVEITNLTPRATLVIDKISLYDSEARSSSAVAMAMGPFDFKKWKPVYNEHGVMILRNNRALPRAWLVPELEAVDGEEALRRIRGQSDRSFDPRQTVLLEVPPDQAPRLENRSNLGPSSARVTEYEPNRLAVETECEVASVLVVSEIDYPGWVATVDGQQAPIYTADYILRAVVLPAGKHQVEMHYTAPAARNGLMISSLTLVSLLGLGLYSRRQSRQRTARSAQIPT